MTFIHKYIFYNGHYISRIPIFFGRAGILFFLLGLLSCSEDDSDPKVQPDNRDPASLVADPKGATYSGPPPEYSRVNVFDPDLLYPGFNYFRSPIMIATNQGTLIALCQMRTGEDNDPKTMVYRRSTDNGETWGELKLMEELTTSKVYGNTVFITDRLTGKIHLIYLESFPDKGSPNPCNMYHKVSSDDGLTWSERELIPNIVYATWIPPGPGTGIQLKRGEHAGRLFIPGRYSNGNYGIYSDDGGQTWNLGYKSTYNRSVGLENEATCVELVKSNGSESVIYINSRNQLSTTNVYRRLETYSFDSGESLTGPFERNNYIKTVRIQANLFRWSAVDQGGLENRILFSAPSFAKEDLSSGRIRNRRRHLGIWSTFDETETWTPVAKRISDVSGSYSTIAKTADGFIGVLFEEGIALPWDEATFVKINEAFLDVPLIGAKWSFEEKSPGTDISEGTTLSETYNEGTSRDIAAVGTISTTEGSEVFGQETALKFDGSSYLKLSDVDTWTQFDFNEYSSFTVETVIKAQKIDGTSMLVGRPHQVLWPQWLMQLEPNGTVSFRIDDDEDYVVVKTDAVVADNKWHHIAAVRDRSTKKLKIYVDGQLSNEVEDNLKGSLANRRPLFIGGQDGESKSFTGEIDFVRISPVAMDKFLQ